MPAHFISYTAKQHCVRTNKSIFLIWEGPNEFQVLEEQPRSDCAPYWNK